MQLTKEFTTVIELMFARAATKSGVGFGIPGDLVSPDTATEEEAKALAAAGFEWREEDGYKHYFVEFAPNVEQ